MAFQVLPPNQQFAEQLRAAVASVMAKSGAEVPHQVLPAANALLSLEVALNQGGELGVLLNGEFFKAALPERYRPGDKLMAQLLVRQGELLLKLLDVEQPELAKLLDRIAPSTLAARAAQRDLQTLLEELVTPVATETLKRVVNAGFRELPEIVLKLLNSKVDAESDGSPRPAADPKVCGEQSPASGGGPRSTEPGLRIDVPAFRAALQKATLDLPALADKPIELTQTLKQMITSNVNDAASEVRRAAGALNELGVQAQSVRFVTALEEFLQSISASPLPLNFTPVKDGEPAPQPTPQQLRFVLETSILLSSSGNRAALADLGRALQHESSGGNPVLVLLQALSWLKTSAAEMGETQIPQELHQILQQLTTELRNLRERRAPDSDVRTILRHSAQQASRSLSGQRQAALSGSEIDGAVAALRSLEQLCSARETVSQLNPVMSAIGQPALHIVPVIIDGLLANWYFSSRSPNVDDSSREPGRSVAAGSEYEQVRMQVELPGLGQVGIELRQGKGEVYLSIATQHDKVTRFVEERFEKLKKRLTEAGFKVTAAAVKTAVSQPVVPEWYNQLVKSSVIA